jgi:hypothetical protein
MDGRETRRYDAFVRVKTFGENNAADFADGSTAQANFTIIGQVIDGLDEAKAGQKPGKNTSKETLLDAIRLDIQNITRTAAAIAQTEPGFADSFRPPANSNEGALLTTADKFLQQFGVQSGAVSKVVPSPSPLVAKFVAHEMDPNFVTNLQNDRDAVMTAQSQQESARETGVGNTANVGPLIKQGMQALNTLDAIMHNKYGSNPDKLAAWMSASHIERDAKRAKPQPTPQAPAK